MSQVQKRAIAPLAVDETKIQLNNAGWLTALTAGGAIANLFRLNAAGIIEAGVAISGYVASSLLGVANGVATLDGTGKIPSSMLPASTMGGLVYRGVLDASAGAYPSSPAKGDYYVISVAGTISGHAYAIGDWATYDGTQWDYIDNSTKVSSVFGRMGAVVAAAGDYTTSLVTEGTNLYFTAARAVGSALTGYASSTGTISATDTVLSAIGKLNGNLAAAVASIPSFTRFKETITISSGNVSATNFSASHAPLASSMILIAFGVVQIEGVDYSISGTTVTYMGDLAQLVAGDKVYLQYVY